MPSTSGPMRIPRMISNTTVGRMIQLWIRERSAPSADARSTRTIERAWGRVSSAASGVAIHVSTPATIRAYRRLRSHRVDALDFDISILERCQQAVEVGLIDDVYHDQGLSPSWLEQLRAEIDDQLLAHL